MNCIISDSSSPVSYETCGNLVCEEGFLHMRRTLDCFVLLFVREGTLHITQNGLSRDVLPGQLFLLRPGLEHFGHRPSAGLLSYYWVHFSFRKPWEERDDSSLLPGPADPEGLHFSADYVLPESMALKSDTRAVLLFRQLLDFSRRDRFSPSYRMHYALSLLLTELTEEFLAARSKTAASKDVPPRFAELLDWIGANFDRPLSARSLAERSGYHPAYLSALFRRHTGCSPLEYLNRYRITASKNLLDSQGLKLETISSMCGFSDPKYYLKLFRRFEGITPSQYREAFSRKKINRG